MQLNEVKLKNMKIRNEFLTFFDRQKILDRIFRQTKFFSPRENFVTFVQLKIFPIFEILT